MKITTAIKGYGKPDKEVKFHLSIEQDRDCNYVVAKKSSMYMLSVYKNEPDTGTPKGSGAFNLTPVDGDGVAFFSTYITAEDLEDQKDGLTLKGMDGDLEA